MFSVHISSYGFTRETDWSARKKRKSNSRLCLEQFVLGSLSNYDGRAAKASLRTRIRAVSNFIATVLPRSIC